MKLIIAAILTLAMLSLIAFTDLPEQSTTTDAPQQNTQQRIDLVDVGLIYLLLR